MIVYDSKLKTVTEGDVTIPFYCGEVLDDTACHLINLAFGHSDLQETYVSLTADINKLLIKDIDKINKLIKEK
tara:strand:- start:1955 stop:2173 length:219 start_codon:yes stop_codon:yes gene_type:complete